MNLFRTSRGVLTEDQKVYITKNYKSKSQKEMAFNQNIPVSRIVAYMIKMNYPARNPNQKQRTRKTVVPVGCFDYNDLKNYEV